MKVTVEVRGERNDSQIGGDVVLTGLGRWVRGAVYLGTPPGSHIGLWRTQYGPLQGLNLRVGRQYLGPCLTLFVHTRPQEEP